MVVLAILLGSVALFVLGGAFYGRHISRVFGEDPSRPTPAVALEDGLDYVPTKTPVVFAHHFASIAGAGPIIGPIIGIVFGWLPALIWIVGGAIFAGAVHDYAATFVSIRERGQSIAVIARRTLGKGTFLLFVSLLIVLMVLVVAMFLILSAKALVSAAPAEALGLSPDQRLIQVTPDGQAQIGGIATMSVILITLTAPLMGWLYLKRKTPVWICSLLALLICGISVALGVWSPVRLSSVPFLTHFGFELAETGQVFWMLCLSGYCLLAAGLPVWIFLQSRDFINVHILYIGIASLVVGLLAAGFQGAEAAFPAFQGLTTEVPEGPRLTSVFLWPFLFITIACGACSGFHSLCASGTTAKQLGTERAARRVGFYAMLLEGFLAVCVVSACLVGLNAESYRRYLLTPGSVNPVLAFAAAIGMTLHVGLGLPVAVGAVFAMLLLEGFIVTTLDTAIRLARYLLEELWATLFDRFDVFAERLHPAPTASGTSCCGIEEPEWNPAGAEGIETATHDPLLPPDSNQPPIATRGALRVALRTLQHPWFNTILIVALMLWMATSGHVTALWALFGAGNQLLAGLSLLIASSWLLAHGRSILYTLIPAVFMLVTTLTMLVQLLIGYIGSVGNPASKTLPLLVFDVLILILTAAILTTAVRRFLKPRKAKAVEPVPAAS